MTDAEQVGTGAGQFGAKSRKASIACLLVLVLMVVAWVAFSASHSGGAQFPAQLITWEFLGLLGAIGICAVCVGLSFRRDNTQKAEEVKAAVQREEMLKMEIGRLRADVASRTRSEVEVRSERDSVNAQVAELTKTNAALSGELERRRLAEKTLSQQQQELVRSKDVLQLHVQARTQELAKLQRRSELILNSVGEGICGFDLGGKITFANPAAAEIMGLPVENLVGLLETEIFAGFGTNGDNVHLMEQVATRPDGSTFVAEFARSPLTEDGRKIGEVILFKDITERRRAEEALAQQAAELARSNAELEQFAFVASHDLQEPLRKIQAFGDRLKAKCDEAKLDAGRDYLERMQSAAARMRRLIDDLLTFSRVISRTEPFATVDLSTIVKEVLGDLEVSVEKSGAMVEVGELPTIEADSVQMRQLLQNLIGNALKFQPPGGKPVVSIRGRIISQSTANGQTTHLTRKAENVVSGEDQVCELIVQDNGIGFEEKYLEKIFAVFQRLHGRQEYEGTGIGLAVCRRIMDRHGGKITAHSKPGEGATFVVILPVNHKEPAPKAV